VYYKEGMPYTLPVSALPLELPEVEKYLPTEDGDPPLGNAKNFAWDEANQKVVSVDLIDEKNVFPVELSTMPGWAGSSWYFLRYMDPKNDGEFCAKDLSDYWGQVDLYIGGSEHATGHLLYSRFWNMFLKDRGYIKQDEPFQKLINQGMILGMSAFVYVFYPKHKQKLDIFNINSSIEFQIPFEKRYIISKELANPIKENNFNNIKLTEFINIVQADLGEKRKLLLNESSIQKIHVDVSLLKGTTDELDTEAFKNWRAEFKDVEFILEDGKYITEREVEKMSKSKYNVVNPDDIAEEYGADCLRLYEMFLGPLEQSKPWNTQGLSGVYGFLKKFYNLYFDGDHFSVSDEEPTKAELKVLHTLIKKFTFDIQNFSFNTSVSQFMIAVNELQKMKCNKRAILEPLAVIISPYAPHICEELWEKLDKNTSIEFEKLPELNEAYLVEDEINYPVSFNGKMKFTLALSADLDAKQIEEIAMNNEKVKEVLAGTTPKKVIVVPKKIINIVL
jgi:leucyl-tRNA synthetase